MRRSSRARCCVLLLAAAGCTVDPNDLCPADACPNAFTITIHRDANAVFAPGAWELRVDSDLGVADATCPIDAVKGLQACAADAATHALLDLGSVTQGNDVVGLYLTVVGNPRRVSLTVLHDGATQGTKTYTPTYTSLQNCGKTCAIAKDTLTIP